MLRRRWAGVLAVLALAPLAACARGGGGGGGGIAVKLAEWSVTLEETSAPAGEVTFDISNEGANVHEFVIFRTDLAAHDLPVKPGESVVDEEGEGLALVDEVEDIAPGSSATLTVDLEPGNYVLLCNIPGHFEQGMHATFTVS